MSRNSYVIDDNEARSRFFRFRNKVMDAMVSMLWHHAGSFRELDEDGLFALLQEKYRHPVVSVHSQYPKTRPLDMSVSRPAIKGRTRTTDRAMRFVVLHCTDMGAERTYRSMHAAAEAYGCSVRTMCKHIDNGKSLPPARDAEQWKGLVYASLGDESARYNKPVRTTAKEYVQWSEERTPAVGEVFDYGKRRLTCMEGDCCAKCYFGKACDEGGHADCIPPCGDLMREDGKSVYYTEVVSD